MRTPCYFVKRTDFVVPLVPGLYKIHSIMWTLAGLSRKIVWHHWLIHQLDIILTLVRIVLAFGYPLLPWYSKGGLWNRAFVALNSTSSIATPTGNIPEASEVGTPLYSGHSDSTNGVRIIEVPLYTACCLGERQVAIVCSSLITFWWAICIVSTSFGSVTDTY